MKTPICSICLQSDILCASCSRNVSNGKISKRGIGIIRDLYNMSKSVRSLENVNIEKIIDTESLIVIVCEKSGIAGLVGRGGRITSELRKNSGKQVKVIGNEDNRSMISHLMFPAKVDAVGKLYSNGVESLKVSIQKAQLRNLPAKKEDLLKAVEELTKMRAELNIQ